MPDSAAKRADPNKGELWITLDQLEQREVVIGSLCSKKKYKSVLQINRKLKLKSYIENNSVFEFSYKVNIKEESMFMIDLSIFTLIPEDVNISVFTDDSKKRAINFNCELPTKFFPIPNKQKGEAKTIFYQKFKLQPNKYVFRFKLFFKEISVEKVDLLFKIGSTSDCIFEEHIEDGI